MRKYIVDHTKIWKLVAIIGSLISIFAIATFAFHNRIPMVEAVTGTKLFMRPSKVVSPSKESEKEIAKYVDSSSLIIGANIGFANFQENTRRQVYFHTKIDDVARALQTTHNVPFPLFTDNTFHNSRIVQLINGQFVCTPTKDTILAVNHPVLNNYSKMICTVAIPPGYGDFVGWINFYLEDVPTFNQMETLRDAAEKMAVHVYERDIIRRKNHSGGTTNNVGVIKKE